MSGYFEPMQWNVCVHRLDLKFILSSGRVVGKGVRTHVNSRKKSLLPDGSKEGRTCDAASPRVAAKQATK